MINIMPSYENKKIMFKGNNTQNKSSVEGYLVKENPIQAMGSSIKNYVNTAKYTVNAIQGKGDDYSVGKINDLTLKLGGLGIAAVLASKTRNPAVRAMEFAGFASFFAAMSIWPKLFIEKPLELKAGFNVNQEYVDSYGRRKRFFEDPQYLPWDLYSSKELNKIGDKLKIPKNIENREKHIQEKMKQIATQSNTLWMLTAGVATPLMASLMGNYASKYVNNVVETSRAKSALKNAGLEDLTANTDNFFKKIFVNPVAELISTLKTRKSEPNNIKEEIINLDRAYDAVFGKSNDKAYETNMGSYIYNLNENSMLTQYDAKTGEIISLNEKGETVKRIKTKNVDGISIFGNKWQDIPSRLTKAIGFTPEDYTTIQKGILKVGKDGTNPTQAEVLAEMLINKFGGNLNKAKLEQSLLEMEKILTPSIEELNVSQKMFEGKLNKLKAKNTNSEIEKFVLNLQLRTLSDKGANTKNSWFAPVRILDIIAQYSDEPTSDVINNSELKQRLKRFISGVTSHQINNDFDNLYQGGHYKNGLNEFFSTLSDKTKTMLPKDGKFAKMVDEITHWTKCELEKFSDYSELNRELKKAPFYDCINNWLGKSPKALIMDSIKQKGIYKGWLKKVGFAFTGLTAITWIAISQFGKTNQYNPNIYKFKDEQASGV